MLLLLKGDVMGLLETSLEVVKLAGKLANPELITAATKANIEALELSNSNLELQKKVTDLGDLVRELDAKLKLTGDVFREGDYVFLEGDPKGFCSRCWDVDRRLIHIVTLELGSGQGRRHGCPQCKTMTPGRALNPRMPQA